MVTVTATDSYGLSASITVTIKVTDVNEDPVLSGDATANYAENGTGLGKASTPRRTTRMIRLELP